MRAILIISVCILSGCPVKAQTASADNKPFKTITFRPIPKGPAVLGVFEGRPPCIGVARQLHIPVSDDCIKLKWSLVLYRDTFTLYIAGGGDIIKQNGDSYRQKFLEGKWSIIKGHRSDPEAEIYVLEFKNPAARLYLYKGDDNVLFVLDENREFRIGNEDFSYTLNRVELVPGRR